MKYRFILFSFVISTFVLAQYPNDCVNYVQVCGNYNINLDVSGPGTQEIDTNACQSFEHNSLWLHVLVEEGGTLGFNLKPQSSAITEDYDFWVLGPNVSCGNLGQAIRCSTTNPQAAGQSNNWTGLRESSVDTTEGPGPDGDSFLEWLTVQPGEEYFFVIDRPIGNSAFELEWTGTAILDNPLEDYTLFDVAPLEICDIGNNGSESFDFSSIANQWINDLTGIEITYHLSETEAFSDLNPLPNITEVQTRTYYVRIENVGSKCFEVKNLQITVGGLALNSPNIRLCDQDNDLSEIVNLSDYEIFNPALGYTISYHLTLNEANNNMAAISPNNFEVTPTNNRVFIRVANQDACVDYAQINFELIEKPEVENQSAEICINETNGTVNLSNYSNLFQAQPQFEVRYYSSLENRENNITINSAHPIEVGNNLVYVRVYNAECYQNRTFALTVFDKPHIGEDETILICPEELPYTLPEVTAGYASYVWNTQEEGVTQITIDEIGDYTVEVTTNDGCVETKTYHVEYFTFPQIKELVVVNEEQINAFSISEYPVFFSLDNGEWQESNEFENVEEGVHYVRVRLETGCVSEPTVTYVLELTNFLSPNNDGYNDTWAFPGLEEFTGSIISIYDRYGKKVYSEDGGKPFIWNGTYNGQKLPTGDYWYIIDLPDGRKHIGHITIKN